MKRKVSKESMSPFEPKHLFRTPFKKNTASSMSPQYSTSAASASTKNSFVAMRSGSSGENEIAAAIWGRDRFNWGGLFKPLFYLGEFF